MDGSRFGSPTLRCTSLRPAREKFSQLRASLICRACTENEHPVSSYRFLGFIAIMHPDRRHAIHCWSMPVSSGTAFAQTCWMLPTDRATMPVMRPGSSCRPTGPSESVKFQLLCALSGHSRLRGRVAGRGELPRRPNQPEVASEGPMNGHLPL